MGKVFAELDDSLRTFIAAQQVFFVATAPLSMEGHINLSPKGLDTFRVLGPQTVAYLDLTGSGVETIAHVRENGRITLLFCAFRGPPRILRLYGRGRILAPGSADWDRLVSVFPDHPGARSLVLVELERIADSCGYGVPLFELVGQRTQLSALAKQKGPDAIRRYQQEKNRQSIDGLPGLSLTEPSSAAEAPAPHIRRPQVEDEAEWARMRTALWPDTTRERHAEEIAAFLHGDLSGWLAGLHAVTVFVAARPGGGLCGFLEASLRPLAAGCTTHPVGYIEGWYVDPDVRRQGVGRRLVQAAEAWARAHGCHEIASDAHLDNAVSLAAHRALGFDEEAPIVALRKWLTERKEGNP